jgi:amidase
MTAATALDTAMSVRSGSLSARASTEQALRRIENTDLQVNAFQIVRAESALVEADAIDARSDRAELPLAGVPIAIKDNVAVTGEPMRNGSTGSDPTPQTVDHPVVARLRGAGAVIVGITRVPELCVFGATDSEFGVTRNPWDLERTPGGSSGGSAAAVASGQVPVAHANDGMGSIRVPAACCGLVGIKPGRGVVPAELGNGSWFDMAENGPVATTVADCAAVLAVMAARPELAKVVEPDRLRVAVVTKAPFPLTPVDPHWHAAAAGVGELLSRAGHQVDDVPAPYTQAMIAAEMARWLAGTARDAELLADRSALAPRTRRHAGFGRALMRAGFPRESGRERWRAHAEAFFADHDVLLTPALATPPIAAATWSGRSWLANIWSNSHYAPYAAPWNLIGWPAIVVPAGMHPGGTPLSVQLVARPGGEATLLGLAATIERVQPWPRTAADHRSATRA